MNQQDGHKKQINEPPLGAIREELQLLKGAPTISGKPTWVIFDPVQHRYFEIDFEVFETLTLWNRFDNAVDLINAAMAEQGRVLSRSSIMAISQFIHTNNLSVEPEGGEWRRFNDRLEAKRVSPFSWLLHNYLFIRFPLVRPSAFLKAAFPYVSFLFTQTMAWIMVVIAVSGLYLVSRQWDEFTSTFADFFSFEGAITYAIALFFIKVLHELGHAFMAVRFGCRVPTMGVAFMMMFPVLYTDVTDAWKLRSRRQRLLIGAAGLLVELSLASIATFSWAFLPEGGLKSIAFVVATISWIMSLAINLNPLMRFDGYYLMTDALGISNLQSRSFAFGRWKLREWLFGLKVKPPELLPAKMATFLSYYAWATWVYRFFLFLGIALLVYTFAFKALGVFLFIVEIIWFIIRPIWNEIKEWPAMAKQIFKRPRVYVSCFILGGLGALVILPVSGRVDVPAIIEPAHYERLFPGQSAKLVKMNVANGQHVAKGDLLFQLKAPALDQKIKLNKIKIDQALARLSRANADRVDKSRLIPLRQQLAALYSKQRGFEDEQVRLKIRAPFSGVIKDLNKNLHKDRWIKATTRLATIIADEKFVVKGYVNQRDLWRIKAGDHGKFIPDDFLVKTARVSISDISQASSSAIDIVPLASDFGGKVSTRRGPKGELLPVSATYKITMDFNGTPQDMSKISRGVVQVQGVPESIASRIWRQVLRVLVRESGA